MKTVLALLRLCFGLAGLSLVVYGILKLVGDSSSASRWVGGVGLVLTILGLVSAYFAYSPRSQVVTGIACAFGIIGSILLLIPASNGSALPVWAEVVYCVGFVLLGWIQYRSTFGSWFGLGVIVGAVGIVLFTLLALKIWVALAGVILGVSIILIVYGWMVTQSAPSVTSSSNRAM